VLKLLRTRMRSQPLPALVHMRQPNAEHCVMVCAGCAGLQDIVRMCGPLCACMRSHGHFDRAHRALRFATLRHLMLEEVHSFWEQLGGLCA